ncbi:MAG: NADH-quinone oxidoreductase subunit J [Acidimicrobiales bacterium]
MVAQNIAFGLLSAAIVVSAIRVVTTHNIVHAALYLVVVLGGIGAQFLLLLSEFVAVTQLLVYVGAIVVLFLFGIMLTRAPIGVMPHLTGKNWPVALGISLLLFGVLSWALVDYFEDVELPRPEVVATTRDVGDSIFSQYILPFEAVSVLLLAALIGAIVLARRD